MAGIQQGEPAFRRWLVAKLALTKQTWPSAPEDELAAWLGVTVEVLREARALQEGTRKFGKYRKVDGVEQRQVRMMLPRPIFLALEELSRVRDVPRQTLLRSTTHHVLCLPRLPDHPNYRGGHGWRLGGVTYRLERRAAESGKKAHRDDVSCSVTAAAFEALKLRAAINGTVPTALMRGGILDLLEGRTQRLQIIPSILYLPTNVQNYTKRWKETDDDDP